MNLFKNRPLLVSALMFMSVSLFSFLLITKAKLILLCLFLAGILLSTGYFIWRRHRGVRHAYALRLTLCFLICGAVALGQSLWSLDRKEAIAQAYVGENCVMEATVTQYRGGGSHLTSYVIDVESINGSPVQYNALLTCYYVADLRPGYRISIQAEGLTLAEAAGDIYEEYALLSDGIFGGFISMSASDVQILDTNPPSLFLKITGHRTELSEAMELRFGKDAAGLPQALFLGERGHIQDHTARDFARTGVSHLLAISGLHMTLLFGLMSLLLKAFGLRPRIRAVILGLCAALYLCYLGFPPSATRAIIMLGMTYLSCLCFADADSLTSLGLAGMGILLVSPISVADMGFWMSFSATLGLLSVSTLFSPVQERSIKKAFIPARKIFLGLISGGVAVTFSLWITAPIFGEISLLSAPMTLLLTPLVGLLLLLIPLSLLTATLPIAPLFTTAIQKICTGMTDFCKICARPSGVVISLRHALIPIIAVAMVAATLLLLGLRLKRRIFLPLPMLIGWVLIFSIIGIHHWLSTPTLNVSYMIPSSTSEMLILTHGHEGVICDFSNGSRRSFITAAEEASKRGATELAAVILTDYHTRTSGSLLQLCERETVRALWLPSPVTAEDYYLMLACLEAAKLTDVPTVIYDEGQELVLFGDAVVTLFHTRLDRSVQPVLLMTLQTPEERLVFCGRSIFESSLALSAMQEISQSDIVILSNRGPTLKQPIQCNFTDTLREVYLANPTVAAYLSPASYPSRDVGITVGQSRFKIKLTD
ncbi:MAG: ComEC/Rec2 family competence protein [Ruminococcaceae bacterium]|nr:ComEC/Rec2 family competence protein [Oscillospiraceae bacterium]